MSECDYFEHTVGLDRKCPLCGGTRTRFGESWSDGDEWRESSFSRQQCKSCELSCKHWDRVAELVAMLRASTSLLKKCTVLGEYYPEAKLDIANQITANTSVLSKSNEQEA